MVECLALCDRLVVGAAMGLVRIRRVKRVVMAMVRGKRFLVL
jgi:hypothetical protein